MQPLSRLERVGRHAQPVRSWRNTDGELDERRHRGDRSFAKHTPSSKNERCAAPPRRPVHLLCAEVLANAPDTYACTDVDCASIRSGIRIAVENAVRRIGDGGGRC
jgi:hypothetical protein